MSTFNAIDLLALPADEQAIMRCLIERPGQTPAEIGDRLSLGVEAVQELLGPMARAGRVDEAQQDGRLIYSARLGRSPQRLRNAPVSLLDLFE